LTFSGILNWFLAFSYLRITIMVFTATETLALAAIFVVACVIGYITD